MTELIFPKTAWLTTNKSCNNRCKWCYAKASNFLNQSMDIDKLKRVVDSLEKNNIRNIVFIGGSLAFINILYQLLNTSIANT